MFYIYEEDNRYLQWLTRKKNYAESRILLTNIIDL